MAPFFRIDIVHKSCCQWMFGSGHGIHKRINFILCNQYLHPCFWFGPWFRSVAAFLDCERFRCGKRCKPSWVTMVCPIRTNGCARECALSNVSMLIQGHDVQTCAARSCCSRPLATMQSNTFPLGEHMSVRTNPATSTVPHAKNKNAGVLQILSDFRDLWSIGFRSQWSNPPSRLDKPWSNLWRFRSFWARCIHQKLDMTQRDLLVWTVKRTCSRCRFCFRRGGCQNTWCNWYGRIQYYLFVYSNACKWVLRDIVATCIVATCIVHDVAETGDISQPSKPCHSESSI